MIFIGNVENAIRFVRKVDNLRALILFVNDNITVNAKSILGLFSLNLTEPLALEVHGDEDCREEVWDAIHEYIDN